MRVQQHPFGTFRLALALLVVLQHFTEKVVASPLVHSFEPGNVAVLVFFFLSGFIITEAAHTFYAGRPGPFIINRTLRIVPMFALAILVAWLVLMPLGAALRTERGEPAPPGAFGFYNLAANLIQIVPLPGRFEMRQDYRFLQIGWALRIEVFFYLVVFAALALGRRSLDKALAWAGAAFAVLAAWRLARGAEWNPVFHFTPYFLCGGALYFCRRAAGKVLFVAGFILMAITQAQTALQESATPARQVALFLSLVGIAVALAGRHTHNRLDRLAGELSYPMYVGHWLPILIAVSVPVSPWLTLCASLLLPVGYWLLLEPLTGKLRDRVRGRRLYAEGTG